MRFKPTHEITYQGAVIPVEAVIPTAQETALLTQDEAERGSVAAWSIAYGVLLLHDENVDATWQALPRRSDPVLVSDPDHVRTTKPGPGLR